MAQERRVEALVRQMSLAEKVGQLNQYSVGLPTGPGTERASYPAMIAAGQVGSLLNVVDAAQADAYQKIAIEQSRLHIPLLYGLDVIHGFRTIFPIPLGLSATWDISLIERLSRLAAEEASAQGVRWTFSPMVDIARDARWGRIAESAGEDPTLGAAIAAAYVRGYQGKQPGQPPSILACAKHFAGYGAAEAGRDYNTTELSQRTLLQVYLPPFKAAVEAGVATVMSAFNAIDGVPASANPFILRQILRSAWGFQGVVVSDWGAIRELMAHGIAGSEAVAARKSLLAGVDIDMESGLYVEDLPGLVRSGAISMARVDESVRRVLGLKSALGLFEHPYTNADATAARRPLPADSLLLARSAAEESFVLLKNRPAVSSPGAPPLLPLVARRGLKIALVGPLADSAADMLGSWSAQGRAEEVVTLRAALAERAAASRMILHYVQGCEVLGQSKAEFRSAIRAARQADVVIVALGEKGGRTGEAASRVHLDLEGQQQALLQAMAATGKPVILVLFNGRPLTISWAANHVPVILEAWFPGLQAGPALVRALFGDINPSGRLTATFPRAVGQEPIYYNALSTGRPPPGTVDLSVPPSDGLSRFVSRYLDEPNAPLYPFGFGLSYTTFSFSQVSASAASISAASLNQGSATLTVHATVTNTGERSGTVVAQCYIRLTGTTVARPVRELKGFKRIDLGANQSAQVEFHLGRKELAFWNLDMKEEVEPATLTVWIAPDAAAGASTTVAIVD